MRKTIFFFTVACLFALVRPVWGQPDGTVSAVVDQKIVKAIEIRGNKTISDAAILSKIKTRVGQDYLQNVISDDLKRLYNTGYFSDVSVDRQDYKGGFKVIIFLTEKPIIDEITFTKTRYYSPRTLAFKIDTKEGKFLDRKVLKDDMDTIRELYAKKGLSNVEVSVDTEMDKTTNKARLHFVINEGQRQKITRINVTGNEAFRDKRIIKAVKTRTAWLFSSGYLKEEVLEEDMVRIESFYEKHGYINAEASYSVETNERGHLTVNISIQEGKQYFVGDITFEGNEVVSGGELRDAMEKIKEGQVFSRDKLDVDLAAIRSLYFDKGYIFAKVQESTSLNPQTGRVDVRVSLNEGGLAYVNMIKIQGNTRTRDIVIRRELRIKPGEEFDGEKLRRSKERLRNLGYFEDISYDIEDTSQPDRKDLVVQVQETKTGTFSFGGGYSSIDQVVGFVEIEQKNFDFTNWPTFTGGGQNLLVHAEAGSLRNNVRLSFTEPWIFDYPVSGGFDLYRTMRLRERDVGYGYDEERLGANFRFGKQLSEYVSGGISYRIEEITIDNLEDNASADLRNEVGTNNVSVMTFRLSRDTRDNVFSPTRGWFLSGTTDVAGGFLGGDKDFIRFQGKTTCDIPLFFGSVLEFRLRTGVADAYGDSEEVPIFERFFAGGAYSIRGYNERKVGPIDPVSEDPIGGEAMLVGNVEYIVPVVEFIKVAAFFDSGNVWRRIEDLGSGNFKSGMGLGLRVRTPIGPINLDYGYPLNDEPGEEEKQGKFYFSISRGF